MNLLETDKKPTTKQQASGEIQHGEHQALLLSPKPRILPKGLLSEPLLPKAQKREDIIDEEKFQRYLYKVKDEVARKVAETFIRQHLFFISMPQFQLALECCTTKFNAWLQRNSSTTQEGYSVLSQTGHSQQWVASLAMPTVQVWPKVCVELDDSFQVPKKDLRRSNTFVMFDDCAYSGDQAKDVLKEFVSKWKSVTPITSSTQPTTHLVLVIPYMTQPARTLIEEKIAEFTRDTQYQTLKIELITETIIPVIADINGSPENMKLFAMICGAESEREAQAMIERAFKTYALAIPAWKRPDYKSFPSSIADGIVCNVLHRFTHVLLSEIPKKYLGDVPFLLTEPPPYHLQSSSGRSNQIDW